MLTAGQIHDLACAQDLIKNADPQALIADKAYDADPLIDSLAQREITPVIPPKSNRKTKRDCDFALYRERNLIERFFNKIKHFRGSHIDRAGPLYDPNADLKSFKGHRLKIFPMTKEAFEQTWNGLVKRSGIPRRKQDAKNGIPEYAQGLEFFDLRREAGSRFNAADLNSDQHDLMLVHNLNKIRGVYIAPAPFVIKAIYD